MPFARFFKLFIVGLFTAAAPLPGGAATFSITSGDFGPSSIPELPSLTEMVGNSFGPVNILVPTLTEISVFKLRQTNPVSVLDNASLVLGAGSFDMSTQGYNAAGTFLGSVQFAGDFNNSLGLHGFDSLSMMTITEYFLIPLGAYFRFDVPGGTETGDPPGVIAATDVLYISNSDGGAYRLQAVPELSTWALLLSGFAALMLVRRLRSVTNGAGPAPQNG